MISNSGSLECVWTASGGELKSSNWRFLSASYFPHTAQQRNWRHAWDKQEVKGWQNPDQTGANPAARQVAKGRGATLQFMAQGYHNMALGRKPLKKLWRNWHGQIAISPSLQHVSTRFYQYRGKPVWTIKFSRYIEVTVVSWLTVSTWGGEFLSEAPWIVCEYIVHYDKAASRGSLTPCCTSGEHILWQKSSFEMVWRAANPGTAVFPSN